MKRTRIAAGLVIALASTAGMAASGERWYGANRGIVYEPIVEPIVVERVVLDPLYPDRQVVYYDPDPRLAPVLVDRTYAYVERPYAGLYESNMVKPLNPETGHLIDNGLFNRTGPNDFGG